MFLPDLDFLVPLVQVYCTSNFNQMLRFFDNYLTKFNIRWVVKAMFKYFIYILYFTLNTILPLSYAADLHRPEEAVAMVKNAINYYKQAGKEKAFAEVSKTDGKFVDKELFVVIMDKNGVVLAHGFYHKMIGTNISDVRDQNGVMPVQEIFKVAKSAGKGWAYYVWPNRLSRVPEPKASYVEIYDGLIFFCGIHYTKKPNLPTP